MSLQRRRNRNCSSHAVVGGACWGACCPHSVRRVGHAAATHAGRRQSLGGAYREPHNMQGGACRGVSVHTACAECVRCSDARREAAIAELRIPGSCCPRIYIYIYTYICEPPEELKWPKTNYSGAFTNLDTRNSIRATREIEVPRKILLRNFAINLKTRNSMRAIRGVEMPQ